MTARVPAGWNTAKIGDVTFKPLKCEPVSTGRDRIRYVDIGQLDGPTSDLSDAPEIDSKLAPSRCRQVVEGGDTLYSTVRPYLRKIAFVQAALDGEFASTGYCVLRPAREIHPRYLYYFMLSKQFEDQLLPLQKGVSYPAVLDREVRAQRVWYPDMPEQRRIVEILEDHLSHLDIGERNLTDAAARAAAMLASGQLRLLRRAASGDRVVTIGDLATVGTGTTPSRARKDFYEGGKVPWVTSGDLSQGVITTPTRWVTDRALSETSLKMYPPGALVVAMYGEGKTRGTVAELAISAATNQACAVVELRDGSLRPWVRAVLDANYDSMRNLAAGGVQPNLNLGLVRSIPIPLPATDVREALLAEVVGIQESAANLCRGLSLLKARAVVLRRAVLAAAFEGKLTGRQSDTEVIEELAHEA